MMVLLLTTRSKRTDEYDWGNLKRVLKYLKGNKKMKLTLIVNSLSVGNRWIYASYNKNDDCRGHTG